MASETHTFLFTDLEGSTTLWERHPTTMGAALSRHDEVLAEVVYANHGTIVKSTGDGVHAVFTSARDGVAAAVDGQRALADAEWPGDLELRVRMGVHLGDATERGGDWYGTEVNRAARVMSVANGGQIVCTRVVEELVRPEFDLVDLGEHRLRDLQSSLQLFQVNVPGSTPVHPPLRSLDAYRSNLPHELSSFIGREEAQDDVARLVTEHRLVTIVGVGGVGKTRLALQVGSELLPKYDDGVWFVELASVLDPADLHDAIAAALKLTPPPGSPVDVSLQQFFEHKHVLLILDNCEHLVAAVASFVSETTTRAPRVSVLATSREALGLRGEHIAPLASLSLPSEEDPETVLASEAGALFTARARESRGDLVIDERAAVAVHALCARLDGIPLALELAAAQTAMMTPTEIERRLDKQFRLASGGRRTALERHQTLRAAIDWSYELLSPGAQQVLARCSVCVGGFDLEAATALASGIDAEHGDGFDLLRELVAKSLVERYEVNGATRYRLLEMIRQYAAEQLLSAGDDATARDLHAAHYLARTVELVTEALTVAEYEALETLGLETPNIAAGARWLLAEQRAAEVMAMFAALPFLDWFVLPAITLDELGAIAEETVTQDGATALDGFGTASMLASFLLYWQGDMERYQRLGDLARSAPDPTASPSSPIYDSVIAMMAGDTEQGAATAARAAEIARAKADPALLVWTLAHYAIMQSTLDYATSDDARSLASSAAEEALALARRQPGTTVCLYPLSAIVQVHHLVDPERSLEAVREIKRIDHSQRKWWLTIARNAAITLPNANAAESLTEWRAVLVDSHEWSARFLLASSVSAMGEAYATTLPEFAADAAAIAESGAIAPAASFTVQPGLIQLAAEQPELVATARARASDMTYSEAMAHLFAAIDAELDEQS